MVSLPPLPTLPITSSQTLENCKRLPVDSTDIFIASFPKSGTTWMQNIVIQLLLAQHHYKRPEEPLLPLPHISYYAPFYEIDAHWASSTSTSTSTDEENHNADHVDGTPRLIPAIEQAHQALGRRVFNTHLRWDMLPTGLSNDSDLQEGGIEGPGATTTISNCPKFIYVVRDGRDVLTSFYHHLSNQHAQDGGFQGTFQQFFEQFIQGKVAYGKWTHHLISWMTPIQQQQQDMNSDGTTTTSTDHPTILLVRYEDLQQDLKGQILRIAHFLNLNPSHVDHYVDHVAERASFAYMQQNQHLFHPISVRWKPNYNFIRLGTVGDYQSLFTQEHQEQFMDSIVADFGRESENAIPSWFYQIGLADQSTR